MNDKAQLHTIEGLAAAVLMTMTVLIITNSTMIVTPQNEMTIDVKLEQMSSDALTVIDITPDTQIQYNLTECVASWDMTEATYPTNNLDNLDTDLSNLLPGILYNVDLVYFENENLNVKRVIINGPPRKNSVVVRHFVTLTNQTVCNMGGEWNLADDELRVVEVRMTSWEA